MSIVERPLISASELVNSKRKHLNNNNNIKRSEKNNCTGINQISVADEGQSTVECEKRDCYSLLSLAIVATTTSEHTYLPVESLGQQEAQARELELASAISEGGSGGGSAEGKFLLDTQTSFRANKERNRDHSLGQVAVATALLVNKNCPEGKRSVAEGSAAVACRKRNQSGQLERNISCQASVGTTSPATNNKTVANRTNPLSNTIGAGQLSAASNNCYKEKEKDSVNINGRHSFQSSKAYWYRRFVGERGNNNSYDNRLACDIIESNANSNSKKINSIFAQASNSFVDKLTCMIKSSSSNSKSIDITSSQATKRSGWKTFVEQQQQEGKGKGKENNKSSSGVGVIGLVKSVKSRNNNNNNIEIINNNNSKSIKKEATGNKSTNTTTTTTHQSSNRYLSISEFSLKLVKRLNSRTKAVQFAISNKQQLKRNSLKGVKRGNKEKENSDNNKNKYNNSDIRKEPIASSETKQLSVNKLFKTSAKQEMLTTTTTTTTQTSNDTNNLVGRQHLEKARLEESQPPPPPSSSSASISDFESSLATSHELAITSGVGIGASAYCESSAATTTTTTTTTSQEGHYCCSSGTFTESILSVGSSSIGAESSSGVLVGGSCSSGGSQQLNNNNNENYDYHHNNSQTNLTTLPSSKSNPSSSTSSSHHHQQQQHSNLAAALASIMKNRGDRESIKKPSASTLSNNTPSSPTPSSRRETRLTKESDLAKEKQQQQEGHQAGSNSKSTMKGAGGQSLLSRARNSTINLASLAQVTQRFNYSSSVGNLLWSSSSTINQQQRRELAELSGESPSVKPLDYVASAKFDDQQHEYACTDNNYHQIKTANKSRPMNVLRLNGAEAGADMVNRRMGDNSERERQPSGPASALSSSGGSRSEVGERERQTITASRSMITVGTAGSNANVTAHQTPLIVCTGFDERHQQPADGDDEASNQAEGVGGKQRERKLSSKEKKKRRQKEAEKVEKLRMLVSYLKSGTSQQLLNPIALEADELELAQRYKMHQILCEDCLQQIEQRQQSQNGSNGTGIGNNLINNNNHNHHHNQPLLSSVSSSNLTSQLNVLDNNPSPISCSSCNCKINNYHLNNNININNNNNNNNNNNMLTVDNCCSAHNSDNSNGSNNNNNNNYIYPQIGTISWVLKHSISDPGNSYINNTNEQSTTTTITTASAATSSRCCHHLQAAASSSMLSHSDHDDVNSDINGLNVGSFGHDASSSQMLNAVASNVSDLKVMTDDDDQQQPNHDHGANNNVNNTNEKMFYIDDLERKDSDTSDLNPSQLIALNGVGGGGGEGGRLAPVNSSSDDNNNNNNNNNETHSPAQSKITTISQSTVGADSISRGSPTRGWSSELMIFSSTPAALATTTATLSSATPTSTGLLQNGRSNNNNSNSNNSKSNNCQTSSSASSSNNNIIIKPNSCSCGSPQHNCLSLNNNIDNNNSNSSNQIRTSSINSSTPQALNEIMGTNNNISNYTSSSNNSSTNYILIDNHHHHQQSPIVVDDKNNNNSNFSSQKQTSAWTNPPNLATWIDNEVNSLVNDLEAKSQFISKQKSTKSSKRKWLSSSGNRRGSSGAHST